MIADNYHKILEKIHTVAQLVGRAPEEVRLVVVTKGHPIPSIMEVVEAGAQFLGENYIEDAQPKIETFSERPELIWHMVGHIQSRKARLVCEYFHRVDSVDRLKLANRLDRFANELGRTIPVLLECNVSGESSKYGFAAWDEQRWSELLPVMEKILKLNSLQVCGLMTMPPLFPDPEYVRPYFQRLARLRDYLNDNLSQVKWNELSMGMSSDFEVAIEEGATMVRIGTAIMGERNS
jgi:PLP dependent protein